MTNKKELKNIKCPHCGASYYSINYGITTLIGWTPVYKDGVQVNQDPNKTSVNCTCCNCGKEFSYTEGEEVRRPATEEEKVEKEAVITGTIRTSSEPQAYPICPHCNGHHTEQLYGTATLSSERNDFCLHYKCLDCNKEFDKEF